MATKTQATSQRHDSSDHKDVKSERRTYRNYEHENDFDSQGPDHDAPLPRRRASDTKRLKTIADIDDHHEENDAYTQPRGTMSRQEAGHRGGSELAHKAPREFFQEIGHKGGEAVANKYGREFYQDIGHKGGQKVSEKYGPDFYREIGHKGGQKVSEKYGPDFYREIGHKGGQKVSEKYGPDFYKEIGHKGGEAVANKYGREFYQDIGHKGGQAVSDKYGPDFYKEIGHKGGEAVANKYGREFYQDIGHKGGQAVSDKYGPDFYREIGHKGGQTVSNKYGREFYQDIGHKGGIAHHSESDLEDDDHRSSHYHDHEVDEKEMNRGRYRESMRASGRGHYNYHEELNSNDGHEGYEPKEHKMSREEAGRKGGLSTSSRMSSDDYREIGHRGGKARRHYEEDNDE